MNRCFSAMKPQQAPLASWQALASGRQTASMNAQSMNGGTLFHRIKSRRTLEAALAQFENRFSRSHFIAGRSARCTSS